MCLPKMLLSVQRRAEVVLADRVNTLSNGLQASKTPLSCSTCSQKLPTNASSISASTDAPIDSKIAPRLRNTILLCCCDVSGQMLTDLGHGELSRLQKPSTPEAPRPCSHLQSWQACLLLLYFSAHCRTANGSLAGAWCA